MSSVVWKFFDVSDDNSFFCVCKLCDILISRGGRTRKTFTTSNMINHLRVYHSEQLAEEQIVLQKKRPFAQLKQLTLTQVIEKKNMWNIDDHKSKIIHKLIGEMIAVNLLPYSFVGDIGFIRLLNHIIPNYCIPSRKYFSENIILEIFKNVKATITNDIDSIKFLSLTIDIWTATTANKPFLCITGHWLTDLFTQQRVLLRVIPLEGSHTSSKICDEITNVLDEYNLKREIIFFNFKRFCPKHDCWCKKVRNRIAILFFAFTSIINK
ncbi:zinc finger BED domain-containing protein 4-like [Octopus sinensis]|uniref:Zinc finger BED domain-containing protein 4-like n=1 Tax=Octopus sinensis TaxID=2607531 RepID=A0A6P7TZY5_9MOLL|nr:zinc finger BED domain-containing protein 4-like [Octopus sinensis]